MSTSIATASPWPARAAHVSAAIFIAASGTVNLLYGLGKASDPASSVVWGAVSVAASITFALSWPALIRARSLSGAIVAVVVLLLSGGYSITAALGSAGAGRMEAAATETASTDARKRAQSAYDLAKAAHDAARTELGTLKPTRAVGELEAMRKSWHANMGKREVWFYEPELARAKRKAELEAAVAKASGQMATASDQLSDRPAGQVANADTKVLARYLAALGADIGPDRLNDLLTLLTVALVEMGGGLSLALGMALSAPPVDRAEARMDGKCSAPEHPRTPQHNAPNAQARTPTEHPNAAERTPDHRRPIAVQPAPGVAEWLAQQGGRAETSRRRLAAELGRSASGVHDELRRLAASGAITMTAGPRGTLLALRPN